MIRVLIADDHTLVRDGLKQILADTADIVVLDEAQDGDEAIAKVQKQDFDVVLLDIAMPGKDGLSVIGVLKQVRPVLAILVVSMYPEEQYTMRALKLGAAGYLTKASAAQELIDAIRKIAGGGRYLSHAFAEKLAFSFGADPGKAPHELLSEREFQVFLLIVAGKTTGAIADQLSLSVKTVGTYRARILEKLGMATNAELIHYAIREGLVP